MLAHRLLPFAAVITPATLNISPMLVTNTTLIAAPKIGFGWEFANEIPEDKLPHTVEEGILSEYPIIQTISTIVKLVQRKSGATDEEIKRQVFLILNTKAV